MLPTSIWCLFPNVYTKIYDKYDSNDNYYDSNDNYYDSNDNYYDSNDNYYDSIFLMPIKNQKINYDFS